MSAQIDDGVRDELAGAMEGRLAAAHSFFELSAPIGAEVFLLLF